MAIKTENTMAEGLQSIMTSLTECMLTADADIPFLAKLQGDILNYLKQPMDAAAQQPGGGMGPGGPGIGGGMPPGGTGMGPGMSPGGMAPMPSSPLAGRAMLNQPSTPGPQMGPQTPPMDELRRMLS